MKKFKIFGKTITATILGLLVLTGLGIAGLLSYYGKAVGTATIKQSVLVKAVDTNENEYFFRSYDTEGNSYCPATPCYDGFGIEVTAGETSTNGVIDSATIDYFEIENTASGVTTKVKVDIPELEDMCGSEITEAGLDTDGDGTIDKYLCDTNGYTPVALEDLGSQEFDLIIEWAINTAPTSYILTLQVAPALA